MHTFFFMSCVLLSFQKSSSFYWALMVLYILFNSAFVWETQQLKQSRLSI